MANLNRTTLIGRLGHDPELRYTTAGQAVASFTLATSERHKNESGELVDNTEWHNIVLWGKLAEVAAEFLVKGKTIYIEGRLQTRKWQDKYGANRNTTEIIGEKFQMFDGKQTLAQEN